MSFAASVLVLICLVLAALYYWMELGAHDPSFSRRKFLIWAGKGVLSPVLLWVFFNSGIVMPPIMSEVAAAKAGTGNWIPVLLNVTAPALLVIGSYWLALTWGCLLFVIRRRLEDAGEFDATSMFWSVATVPFVGIILYFAHWAWAGFALMIWFLPILHSTLWFVGTKTVGPCYSRAIAKMKFGRYDQAESEVIRELETRQDDFDGWLMLAELYANHFHDMAAAEQTILETCLQPNVTPPQFAVALNRLADWHLKIARDPMAARGALEFICQRFPGTHLARMAQQRIEQLPATREELQEQSISKPIRLPALNDHLDERPEGDETSESKREEAISEANRWVGKLKQNPNDVPAREELARIFARLERGDLAIGQLELLMEMPDQSDRKRAEWLSLIAAWQIRYQPDLEAGQKTLERLIQEYPQSVQAFAAQRRLNLIRAEQQMQRARSAKAP